VNENLMWAKESRADVATSFMATSCSNQNGDMVHVGTR